MSVRTALTVRGGSHALKLIGQLRRAEEREASLRQTINGQHGQRQAGAGELLGHRLEIRDRKARGLGDGLDRDASAPAIDHVTSRAWTANCGHRPSARRYAPSGSLRPA